MAPLTPYHLCGKFKPRCSRPDIFFRVYKLRIKQVILSMQDDNFVRRIMSVEHQSQFALCHEEANDSIKKWTDNVMEVAYTIMEDLVCYEMENIDLCIQNGDLLGVIDDSKDFTVEAESLITQIHLLHVLMKEFYALMEELKFT